MSIEIQRGRCLGVSEYKDVLIDNFSFTVAAGQHYFAIVSNNPGAFVAIADLNTNIPPAPYINFTASYDTLVHYHLPFAPRTIPPMPYR